MGHYASSLLLDEDVYEEMKLWFKGLVAMWRDDDEKEQDCIFIENGKHANEQRHMTIECIPMPKEPGDLAPIYFKKAIMDSEKEWSDNKKLIELSKSQYNGNIRKAVPKGFPFFSVNFGLQPGYAHVIEHENIFPDTFAQEIVAGMMNLPHSHWRKVKPQSFNEIKEKGISSAPNGKNMTGLR
uniref:CWF19-like protein 2 n=1 Tax=Ditylenchus dipsaci TaxID=166011 RepID=A0A915EWY6_9BILA